MSSETQSDFNIPWNCYGDCSICLHEINNKNNGWPCDHCEQWLCTDCTGNNNCSYCINQNNSDYNASTKP